MDNDITKEMLQSLAAANGINLPEARLDRVLKQYRSYLQLLARLDAFELKREAEPQTIFTLVPESSHQPARRNPKGEPHGNR